MSSPAAPLHRALRAQAAMELRLTLRQGENLLVILILPVLLLLFFASARIVPTVAGSSPADYLVPGILTVAVMSTGMVSLGIATAYQRSYGVLKRLGGSPLPRGGLIAAKGLSVLVIEAGQVALIGLVALWAYHWRPQGAPGLAVLVLLLGAITFAAMGLAMAGGLRAELTLAGANGLYVLFLVLGGVVLPVDHLPGFVQPLAQLLPVTALCSTLRATLTPGAALPTGDLVLLVAWLAVAVGLAVKTFRWE